MLFREIFGKKKNGNSEYYEWEEMGQTLTGKLVNIRKERGKYGIKNIYEIKTDNGAVYDVRGSSVLDNKLTDDLVGDIIQIEFLGQETSLKNGESYYNFRVSVGYDE